LTVKFYDRSTGEITEWRWNFGDGGTSTQRAPSHTYTSAGKYTVTLVVEGPGGFDSHPKPQFVYIFTISEAANRELFAVRKAISDCMAAAVATKLDAQAIAWDGSPGLVTAGTEDAADYLPPEPLKATYDVRLDGTVYNGTDVSWTGIYWDASPGVDRWRGVGD
jgi:PKD repeat protein